MREFRKKQKTLKKIMNILCIFTAIFMFGFIFAEPFIEKSLGMTAVTAFSRTSEILVLVSIVVLFIYNVKYSKTNSLLEWIEYELDDNGHYYLNRNEKDRSEFIQNSQKLLIEDKYIIENNVDAHDFDVSLKATYGKNMIYFVDIDDLDRNDIIAYIDGITYEATVKSLKRRADIVIVFVTNKADEDSIALAKMVTTIGKKDQIKMAMAIAEIETGNCYFLGNRDCNLRNIIAKYVMCAQVPFDDKLISKEKLKSQNELEENMKTFNAKDFVDGKFFIR